MHVLLVEPHADGLLDLAIRAWQHGHAVRYFCKDYDPHRQPVGRGLVDRVVDWHPSMNWADLVVLGSNAYCMTEFDRWQREGVPIIGAGSAAAQWELDRLAGMEEFRKAGIPVADYQQCRTLDEAIAVARSATEGMAVKPCGDITDKTTSCVAKTPEEMLWRLQRWRRIGKRFPQGVILQERIVGVEMAVGAWFGPDGFAEGWEENFEEKKLFAGGLGPACGEAGTVMRLVKRSKLADQVLKPFEDRLAQTGFVGNVDVNCIIDLEGHPWPLEWTCRNGYPAINIELALHRGDPIEFLAGVAAGKPPKTRALDEVAVGVVMALPPYPFRESVDETVGVPIWGVTPGIEDNLHFCQAQASPGLATAGSYVLVSTGTGATVQTARREAYRVLDRLTVPAAPFWRNDIGQRLRGELEKVQRHGFASGLEYA